METDSGYPSSFPLNLLESYLFSPDQKARDNTNAQYSTVGCTFSLYGRLHSETQPRLDALGFQMPTISKGCVYFPPFLKKHEYTKTARAYNCQKIYERAGN